MSEILNYIKINELISTSGQPSIEQFKERLPIMNMKLL